MATAMQGLDQELALGFKHILIATDFSEASRQAFPYGLGLARQYGSEIFVAHVAAVVREAIPLEPFPQELDRWREEAEQQMEGLVESTGIRDVKHHCLLERGPVAHVLAAIVKQKNIDLLVLGTHGRGGLRKIALGSVAEGMLRLVPCPVLTVGQHVAALPGDSPTFKRILFATDFGNGATKALPVALALAQKYRARFILLHMVEPTPIVNVGPAAFGGPTYYAEDVTDWEAKKKQESVRNLLELVPLDTKLPFAPEYVVGANSAPEGILSAAAEYDVDLIVMGANRVASPGVTSHVPWSVVHRVLCEARCPVLTVRA